MSDEVNNPAVHRSSFRFHRFLFSLLAAISLLLCVATVTLFVASFLTPRMVDLTYPRHISVRRGHISLAHWGAYMGGIGPPPTISRFRFAGVGYRKSDDGMYDFECPIAWLIVVTAVLPLTWKYQRVVNTQIADKSARCPACGYDLRATPERCPECGEPAMKAES